MLGILEKGAILKSGKDSHLYGKYGYHHFLKLVTQKALGMCDPVGK